jgi:hypothetical protein
VCIKHGATWTKKRCSSEGCTNIAKKGGVCMKHGAKFKRCSSDGCRNIAQKGGVCKRHGAKVERKRCSSEGCSNYSKRGGVCKRHGAYRNPNDESTAFASYCGSEFDKTTVTHPSKRGSDSPTNQGFPAQVVLCGVIAENYEEV